MKNIWEVCDFADEVESGDLSISKFAVELHSILDGTADPTYLDPKTFLERTYTTEAMRRVITDSLTRLTNNQGTPVSLLDVSFGGGKTHSLVLLYHLFNNSDLGSKFIQNEGISKDCNIYKIPETRVIAIDGRYITKKTLWGEIADGFGRYEEFQKLDEEGAPIQDISQIKSLFDGPTLVMLDEIPQYLSKLKNNNDNQLYKNTLLFLNELASAVASVENSRLIITTTAEQKLLEEETANVKKMKSLDIYGVVDGVKEAVSRSADSIVPVKEKDAYGVMRKRLVKNIDEIQRDQIIDEYYRYYDENGLIEEPNYKEKLRQSYPFHPFLIETLYERVGTIPEFNKTRGMFNLLGTVLHHILENKIDCSLVGTGDMQLDRPDIMEILTAKVNKDFKEVIESDCVDKPRKIDEDRSEKLATKIACTIYMYSLINATRISGIYQKFMKLAVGRPGIDLGMVETILAEDIATKFWYIKEENQQFYFDQKPNLNKIISVHEENVTDKDTRDIIMSTLKKTVLPLTGVKPIIWSKEMLDEEDTLRLFVVDYEGVDLDNISNYVDDILLHKPGGDIRHKQNTIVVLYPDTSGISGLKDSAKLVAAITSAEKDEKIRLTKEYEKSMKVRLGDAKNKLDTLCKHTYSKICYPTGPVLRLDQISTIIEPSNSITDSVISLLRDKGKTFGSEESLSPDIIQFDDTSAIMDIFDSFRINRSQRIILDNKQLFKAMERGIEDNAFVYSAELEERDGRYVVNSTDEITWTGYLIKNELVLITEEPGEEPEEGSVDPDPESDLDRHRCHISANNVEDVLSVLSQLMTTKLNHEDIQSECRITLSMEGTTLTIQSNLDKTSEIISMVRSFSTRSYTGKGTLSITSTQAVHDDFNDIEGIVIT